MKRRERASFTPDWKESMTSGEMEWEFTGFTFKGPGWYLYKDQTFLIYNENRPLEKIWNQNFDLGEKFEVLCYYWNPGPVFSAITHAPTRVDTR